MRGAKPFTRSVFMIFLLACLLTGLAGTVRVPVQAAPQAQATTPPTLQVIISEIGWGGTVGASSTDEWIELYNPGGAIDFLGEWLLISEGTPPNVNITLTGSIASGGYYLLERQNDSVILPTTANQIYSGPGNLMDDTGETLYLYAPDGSGGYILVDVVNSNGGPWPVGLDNGYGSMERYGVYEDTDYIWTTNQNPDPAGTQDFRGNPIYGTPGTQNWAETTTPTTITTIVSDSPDPSVSNGVVNVAVTVLGGPTTATGTVNVTGADTNCTITLANGVGNCNVSFTSTGTKTLTATYSGDTDHLSSSDTEAHSVVPPIGTTTIISSVKPSPTYVNENTTVSVTVSANSGSVTPTGTVSITGANTNCTITLSNGTGDCNVVFTSVGTKTLTATYNGYGAFTASNDTENVDALYRTTTTITADTPDSSSTNQPVSVSVSVESVGGTPTGTVQITGATSNCSISLASGKGTCAVNFSTSGTKTLTATYSGDSFFAPSTDTETHSVIYIYITPTPRPGSVYISPPPPLLGISEFVPRPGHDWNNDGVVNTGDEYIELINHGVVEVNLSGYRLDDEANIGSPLFSLPSMILKPGKRIVFYGSETGLLLSDGGDGVRLLKSNGQLVDAYNYSYVDFPDQAFCRLPDNGGLDDWNTNCYPTPGLKNSLSGTLLRPSTQENEDQALCPVADTLPEGFVRAECYPFGNNIWSRYYWDQFGWYGGMALPNVDGRWEVYAD